MDLAKIFYWEGSHIGRSETDVNIWPIIFYTLDILGGGAWLLVDDSDKKKQAAAQLGQARPQLD